MPTSITFNISGYVTQEINIVNSKYKIEDIVNGLNGGVLATTTYMVDGNKRTIEVIETGEVVAEVVSTIPSEDTSYTDFAVELL